MPDFSDESYEWDTDKSDDTYGRRGFDFDAAVGIFDNDYYLEAIDDRHDYGEERIVCIGSMDGEIIVVVYTQRGSRKRIISARLATDEEIYEYRQTYPAW